MSDYGANPNPDDERITQVAFGYKIAPELILKVDQHSAPDSLKAYHLVKRIGSTNVWVLVAPPDIPAN